MLDLWSLGQTQVDKGSQKIISDRKDIVSLLVRLNTLREKEKVTLLKLFEVDCLLYYLPDVDFEKFLPYRPHLLRKICIFILQFCTDQLQCKL